MRRPWLRRMWIVLIALCFAASIAIPIWAGIEDGLIGVLVGIYLGLIPAAAGLLFMVIDIVVRAWVRAKQPQQEVLPALPVARLARH